VAGARILPATATRITVEGFYKRYANYPVSARNGISLANLGGDFAVLGNEAVRSTGLGPSYGVEFLSSRSSPKTSTASWPTRCTAASSPARTGPVHRVGLGQPPPGVVHGRLPVSAQLGTGGAVPLPGRPALHPVDSVATLRDYPVTGATVLDYSQLNTQRLSPFNALDVRLDKKWNFKGWFLNVFLDVQNLYNSANPDAPSYTLARDDEGNVLSPAQLFGLPPGDSAVVPTIGLIVEF
jgi:hypothetical protein